MAAKTHCDVCDAVVSEKPALSDVVLIDAPNNMTRKVRAFVSFSPEYRDEDDDKPLDLCRPCRGKVLSGLAARFKC